VWRNLNLGRGVAQIEKRRSAVRQALVGFLLEIPLLSVTAVQIQEWTRQLRFILVYYTSIQYVSIENTLSGTELLHNFPPLLYLKHLEKSTSSCNCKAKALIKKLGHDDIAGR
jgi:hypothetical protein